jgi:hypothetical protein
VANTDGTQPFDPAVGGMSTNLTSSAAASLAAKQEPLLWVGREPIKKFVPSSGGKFASETGVPAGDGGPVTYGQPVYLTPSQLLNAYDKMDRDSFLRFRNLFVAAGIVAPGADPASVRNAYTGVIGDIASQQEQGIRMNPMGLIRSLISKNGLDASDIGSDEDFDPFGTGTNFTGTKTQVHRNVTDIDEGEAWSTIQSNLSQLLGRDPNDQETRDFTYRMGQLAARNPSVSKTATSYKNGEVTGSSTHTTPGFTQADMAHEAYDDAQNDPGYAEYRSASYLYNAVLSALGPLGG